MNLPENLKIRPAMVAGMFYSGKKQALEREVALFLENSQEHNIPGKIAGIISPHAGYMYSGGVAARAYRQIMDKQYNVVVVIAPSHREYFTEISVYDGYAYATPLGHVPIDQILAKKLANHSSQIILSEKGHRFDEHSLEVQLPFLQIVLEDFKLVPVVMGEHSLENIEALAKAIVDVFKDENALIVASSDLSHFYSQDRAEKLDSEVSEDLKNFDENKLFKDIQSGKCEMCGGGPAVAMMKACRMLGADKSEVLLYRTSGDVTGDKREVVGYLSAIFY